MAGATVCVIEGAGNRCAAAAYSIASSTRRAPVKRLAQ
jgi:hypothetical protein